MNGIHEVASSILAWSTNLRSLALPQGASYGSRAGLRAKVVHRSGVQRQL